MRELKIHLLMLHLLNLTRLFVEGNTLILYHFYDLQRLATYICLLHVFIRDKIGPIRKGLYTYRKKNAVSVLNYMSLKKNKFRLLK